MINKKYSTILKSWRKFAITVAGVLVFSLIFASVSFASDVQKQVTCNATGAFSNTSLEDALNNLWVLVAGILVLMMQLGFAMVEAGFNAAKNTVNVLFKNVADACLGILVYFVFGYALMYRPETTCQASVLLDIPGIFGISQLYLFLNGVLPREGAEHLSVYIDFFFQAAFAATAATICSGAVAGRIKPWAYLVLTFLITGLVYPVSGYWVWGGGWLQDLQDFAGSLVVHAVGGGAALAVVLILKPRIGMFSHREEMSLAEENELSSHSLPLATMGTFILWIGWYGFNAGSAFGITENVDSRSPHMIGIIILNTTIAACSSGCTVMIYRWFRNRRRIDLSTLLNGVLGGLVGITASCNAVSPAQSLIIGIVAGLIVIVGIKLLYELKIDDAVGAIPVHCFCGIWGGLAAALFVTDKLGKQLFGSLFIPLWSFTIVWLVFTLLNKIFGIRVSQDKEKSGLDWSEHGEYAYLSLEKEEQTDDEYI